MIFGGEGEREGMDHLFVLGFWTEKKKKSGERKKHRNQSVHNNKEEWSTVQ